jgi:MFS family permease
MKIVCAVNRVVKQLNGINAVMFYAESIFVNAGVGTSAPYYVALLGLAQVIFTFGSVRVVDLYGRKVLLQWASVLMTLSLFSLGFLFHYSSAHQMLPVICLVVFMLGFSVGWGPVPTILAVELFPLRARSTAGGIAIGVSWISSFIVTSTFPYLVISLGPSIVFTSFGLACIMAGVFVHQYIPETKGRSLEDIQMNTNMNKLLV